MARIITHLIITHLIKDYASLFGDLTDNFNKWDHERKKGVVEKLVEIIHHLARWEGRIQRKKHVKDIIDFLRKYNKVERLVPGRTKEEIKELIKLDLKRPTYRNALVETKTFETQTFTSQLANPMTTAFLKKMTFLNELNEISKKIKTRYLGFTKEKTYIRFINRIEAKVLKKTNYQFLLQIFEAGEMIPTLEGIPAYIKRIKGMDRDEKREFYHGLGGSGDLGAIIVFKTRTKPQITTFTRGRRYTQANFFTFTPIELEEVIAA